MSTTRSSVWSIEGRYPQLKNKLIRYEYLEEVNKIFLEQEARITKLENHIKAIISTNESQRTASEDSNQRTRDRVSIDGITTPRHERLRKTSRSSQTRKSQQDRSRVEEAVYKPTAKISGSRKRARGEDNKDDDYQPYKRLRTPLCRISPATQSDANVAGNQNDQVSPAHEQDTENRYPAAPSMPEHTRPYAVIRGYHGGMYGDLFRLEGPVPRFVHPRSLEGAILDVDRVNATIEGLFKGTVQYEGTGDQGRCVTRQNSEASEALTEVLDYAHDFIPLDGTCSLSNSDNNCSSIEAERPSYPTIHINGDLDPDVPIQSTESFDNEPLIADDQDECSAHFPRTRDQSSPICNSLERQLPARKRLRRVDRRIENTIRRSVVERRKEDEWWYARELLRLELNRPGSSMPYLGYYEGFNLDEWMPDLEEYTERYAIYLDRGQVKAEPNSP